MWSLILCRFRVRWGQSASMLPRMSNHASASLFFVNQTNFSQHISVQAESILPWGSWQGMQAWSSWQDASLTLPGYSMAVLTLHRNGSNEVFTFNNSVSARAGSATGAACCL